MFKSFIFERFISLLLFSYFISSSSYCLFKLSAGKLIFKQFISCDDPHGYDVEHALRSPNLVVKLFYVDGPDEPPEPYDYH